MANEPCPACCALNIAISFHHEWGLVKPGIKIPLTNIPHYLCGECGFKWEMQVIRLDLDLQYNKLLHSEYYVPGFCLETRSYTDREFLTQYLQDLVHAGNISVEMQERVTNYLEQFPYSKGLWIPECSYNLGEILLSWVLEKMVLVIAIDENLYLKWTWTSPFEHAIGEGWVPDNVWNTLNGN